MYKNKAPFFWLVFILFLSACSNFKTTTPTSFKYEPNGKEEFVITKEGYDRPTGYTGFFKIQSPYDPVYLRPEKYIGIKGYFDDDRQILDSNKIRNYIFRSVTLETGEKYLYGVKAHLADVFSKHERYSLIKRLPIYEKEKTSEPDAKEKEQPFSPFPLVEGSNIIITSVKVTPALFDESSPDTIEKIYYLNNGRRVGEEKLRQIRNIAERFPEQRAKVAELLLNLSIRSDYVDKNIFIKSFPAKRNDESNVEPYLVLDSTMRPYLYLEIRFAGDNWLFVNNYKIAADDYRWSSDVQKFKRDHSGGRVWEWIVISPTKTDIGNMEILAKSRVAIIRFQGDKYYSDYQLTSSDQTRISIILNLFEALTANK